jgi:hypothetical protein
LNFSSQDIKEVGKTFIKYQEIFAFDIWVCWCFSHVSSLISIVYDRIRLQK